MIALKSKGTTGLNHSSTLRESRIIINLKIHKNWTKIRMEMNADKSNAEYRFLEEGLKRIKKTVYLNKGFRS